MIGKKPPHIQREFKGVNELLKYWRDCSAHGRAFRITANQSHLSLMFLLKFALFASENWDELISD
jgi:hypothetical protein